MKDAKKRGYWRHSHLHICSVTAGHNGDGGGATHGCVTGRSPALPPARPPAGGVKCDTAAQRPWRGTPPAPYIDCIHSGSSSSSSSSLRGLSRQRTDGDGRLNVVVAGMHNDAERSLSSSHHGTLGGAGANHRRHRSAARQQQHSHNWEKTYDRSRCRAPSGWPPRSTPWFPAARTKHNLTLTVGIPDLCAQISQQIFAARRYAQARSLLSSRVWMSASRRYCVWTAKYLKTFSTIW